MNRLLVLAFFSTLLSVSCAHHRHEGGDHKEQGEHASCSMKDHRGAEGVQCEFEKKPHRHEFLHRVMGTRPKLARAELQGLGKNKASGQVFFQESEDGVKAAIHLKGLKPNAKQGLHIHEFGSCASADGSSAGGHFNPFETAHAAPTEAIHHVGDLGNVTADEKGTVDAEVVLPDAAALFLVGRSVVLHAKEDDYKSQPAGASGDRVACGVIGFSKE